MTPRGTPVLCLAEEPERAAAPAPQLPAWEVDAELEKELKELTDTLDPDLCRTPVKDTSTPGERLTVMGQDVVSVLFQQIGLTCTGRSLVASHLLVKLTSRAEREILWNGVICATPAGLAQGPHGVASAESSAWSPQDLVEKARCAAARWLMSEP